MFSLIRRFRDFSRNKRPKPVHMGSDLATQAIPINMRPIFVTGTGRSGTHFFSEVFQNSKQLAAYHLDDVSMQTGDSFQFYSKWHGLTGENESFLKHRACYIHDAMNRKLRYFESNPLVAFSVEDLWKRFGSISLVVLRNARDVVESLYRKNWYETFPKSFSSAKEYNYFYSRSNHSFSRILPRNESDFNHWISLTRLGKLSWLYKVTYEELFGQLHNIRSNDWQVITIDNFSYSEFLTISQFLGIAPCLSQRGFQQVSDRRPGAGPRSRIDWDLQSKNEFNEQIRACESFLGNYVDINGWLF